MEPVRVEDVIVGDIIRHRDKGTFTEVGYIQESWDASTGFRDFYDTRGVKFAVCGRLTPLVKMNGVDDE